MDIKSWKDKKENLHNGRVLKTKDGFDVIKCKECGFAHIIPIPTSDDLETIYSHEYYDDEKPLYIERYIGDKDWHDVINSERYDIFEQYISSKDKRILDIGSGPGLFLKHGQDRGWDVHGIEPSKKAYKYSVEKLDLSISNVFFNKETYKNFDTFDVVNLSLVLEHIPDPAEMIQLIRSITKKDGLISISVPNDFNPFQKILNKNLGYIPWWISSPHHINYFNHNSLSNFIERMGYKVVHQEGSFPIDLFLLMGENYINNEELGRECHEKRKIFDINLANDKSFSKKLRKSFSKIGIGREVILFAKKID
jgi:SAM-dependent methyltransferase